MARKQVQLQQEITTDEEWTKLLEKEGLIVVDIFSDWCGPCSAMSSNLKKVKLEIGGDNLQLAAAKSDTITALERFRTRSEPTWMFIADGQMVNLMYGANAPDLTNLIIAELKKQEEIKEGTMDRDGWDISEMAPDERTRYDAAKEIEDEANRIATLKREQDILEWRTTVANVVLHAYKNLGVVIIFPQAKDIYRAVLTDLWEPAGLAVSSTERPHFTEKILEELLYFAETEFDDVDTVNLLSSQTVAFLVKPTAGEDFQGSIDEKLLGFVYGESKCPPGSPESPAQQLIGHVLVPKEVKEESLEKLALPSAVSLSGLNVESEKNIQSRAELRSRIEVLSKIVIRSTPASKEFSKMSMSEKVEEEEEPEYLDISGVWVPPNALTRATAIKLLFPRAYDPIALPEPVPIPPHVALAWDSFKRIDVIPLLKDYPDDVMRLGFFTSDNPDTAQLVAKSIAKYERGRRVGGAQGEKLVIQLSRKRSEAWCAFSQLNPTYMSHTTEDGERDCKLFFPEGYDEPEEEIEEVVEEEKPKKKKKKRKAAKKEVVAEQAVAEGEEEEEEEEGEEEGEGGEGGEGGEEEGVEEGDDDDYDDDDDDGDGDDEGGDGEEEEGEREGEEEGEGDALAAIDAVFD